MREPGDLQNPGFRGPCIYGMLLGGRRPTALAPVASHFDIQNSITGELGKKKITVTSRFYRGHGPSDLIKNTSHCNPFEC